MVLSVVARCMSGEEEKMSLEIWCDLLEAELKRALEDLSVIRGLDKAQAKSKSHMLRAALNNAQHYFREIQRRPIQDRTRKIII